MSNAICPHLGLHDDETLIRTAPTTSHRCYARRPPAKLDVDYQAHFCLGGACNDCPFFPEDEKAPTRTATDVMRNPARVAVVAPVGGGRDGLDAVDEFDEEERGKGRRWGWVWTGITLAILGAFALVLVAFGMEWLRPPSSTVTTLAASAALPTDTVAPTVGPTATPIPAGQVESAFAPTAAPRLVTPTPVAGGQVFNIVPRAGDAGWWAAGDTRANHLGDSFLYAGRYQDQEMLSMVRFDLAQVPRGAEIVDAALWLNGLDANRLAADGHGTWLVQLLPESALGEQLAKTDFLGALSAPAAITLPPLRAKDLHAGEPNTFPLDASARQWLAQQLLDGATSIGVRLLYAGEVGDTVFAWDSGAGSQSSGAPPALVLNTGAPPPTPPPVPTKPFIVATLTPIPANALTVVAQAATATAVAETVGTYTPIPYRVYTPTPFPQNLATVQAVAQARGLPVVLLLTPTPGNAATATSDAAFATAVALTTGTFTPVPPDFVTPIVIAPSPPAENVATAAARVLLSTAEAERVAGDLLPTPTPTPLPYNAVVGAYVYATAAPENVATAAVLAQMRDQIARTTGTPTPLPWNAIIITPVPTPQPPTSTPIPLFVPESDFTPTPTPTETGPTPSVLPNEVRGRILFKSDRSGKEALYMLDPGTGDVTLITQPWVYSLVTQQWPLSPDGQTELQVRPDADGQLQIQAYSREFGNVKQITALRGSNYDPAWSPTGEWIAFVSTTTGGDEIWRVDPTGQIAQRLTVNWWEWDKHPSWSPDGSQIVFYSNRDSGRKQLWIMNADGTGQTNLSANEYNDWDPIWVH